MSLIKQLQNWRLQPRSQLQTNRTKMIPPLLAVILIAETILLLIIPFAYYASLPPTKNVVSSQQDQNLPLTTDQIKAAWPNLASAQEIVDSGKGDYSSVDTRWGTVDFNQIYNHTWLSPVNAEPRNYPSGVFVTRLVPVENFIWMQLNGTTWISPGNSWLITDHPPYVLPSPADNQTQQGDFLETGLSTEYVIAVSVIISATAFLGIVYLLRKPQPLEDKR